MRILVILGMNLIILTGLASPVMAGTEPSPFTPMANQFSTVAVDHVVYPTGTHPTDVNNVQAAVSQGGIVLLKAKNADGQPMAFEFGVDGCFYITEDVAIFGEGSGSGMTTIRGGLAPVRCYAPVHLAVRGIHFERPRYWAIGISHSVGVVLSSNLITGVIGVPLTSDPSVIKGQGIWIVGVGDPHAISGSITIADNTIEDVDALLGHGIVMIECEAETTIVGNHISGMNTCGIMISTNIGGVRIKDNIIVPGPERYPGYFSVGNGIYANFSFGGDHYFADNTIICENPLADGIVLWRPYFLLEPFPEPKIVIERNHVTMLGSWFGGITLAEGFSGAYIGQNRIDGQGMWAIGVFSDYFPEVPMTGNTFQGNNVSGFTANVADYFLDVGTQNTIVLGRSGTVVDLGSGNRITGITRMRDDVPVGQVIRQAQAGRRALAEAAKVDGVPQP